MTTRVLEALLRLSARDATGDVFGRVAGKVSRAEREITAAQRRLNMAARGVSSTLAWGKGIVAGYLTVGTAKALALRAGEVSRSMTELGVTADVSNERLAKAASYLSTIQTRLGSGLLELTEAQKAYVAAGMDFDTALAAVDPTVRTAKATGAAVADVATTGVAMLQNLQIKVGDLTGSFDTLTAAAKAGRFEMVDMARELPAVAASGATVGLKGREGLASLAAGLTIVREATGTSSEAANDLKNLFGKLLDAGTIKNAKKFGININKMFSDAEKNGTNFVEAVIRRIRDVTKGDPFKLKALVPDVDANKALTALVKNYERFRDLTGEVASANGVVAQDFGRMMADTQGALERISSHWDRLYNRTSELATPGVHRLADGLDDAETREGGLWGGVKWGFNWVKQQAQEEKAPDLSRARTPEEVAALQEAFIARQKQGESFTRLFVGQRVSEQQEDAVRASRKAAYARYDKEQLPTEWVVAAKSPRDIEAARIRKLEEIDIPAARALVGYEGSRAVMQPKRERRLQELLGRLEEMKKSLASFPEPPSIPSSLPPADRGLGQPFPVQRPAAASAGQRLPPPRPSGSSSAPVFPIPHPRPAIPEGAAASAPEIPQPRYRPRPEGPDPLDRIAGAFEQIAAAGIAPPAPGQKPIDILSLFATTGAGKISAEVAGPVTADLTGQANVNVNIRYIGPIGPAGTSVSSSGHIRANVGVSMPDVE